MRILIVHNRYREPGGEDSVVHAEADLLAQHGHSVQRFEIENPPSGPTAAAALARSSWNRSAAAMVSSAASNFRPDVVHVHNTWYALSPAPLWALRHNGAARVVTLHNYRLVCVNANLYRDGHRCTDCVGAQPWRGVARRCYRGSFSASLAVGVSTTAHRLLRTWQKQAEVLVVPSLLARDLLVLGGVPEESIVVKPHFVRDPGPRKAPPSSSRTVVYAGRFSPEKGLLALVEAWRSLAPPGLELVLVGDGELSDVMKAAGPGIRVIGWRPRAELTQIMLEARAVIAPSQLFETFGLTAAEAMAAGTPVVTVAGGAIAEVAGGVGPAGVVSASSAAEWKDRLQLLSEPSAVDAWGSAARQRFEDLFDPQHGIDSLLGVYRTAITRRSQRLARAGLRELPTDPDYAESRGSVVSSVEHVPPV